MSISETQSKDDGGDDGAFPDERSGSPQAVLHLPPSELLLRYPSQINICAPMVRYSKHAFRTLVSCYDTQITTTPMIIAREFSRSENARNADFSTSNFERGVFDLHVEDLKALQGLDGVSEDDEYCASSSDVKGKRKAGMERVRGSLVCQMAASDGKTFADAAELLAPYVDGVDLNCGCPQGWAFDEGIGSALLRKPETVREIVRSTKARLGEGFCVSVKIRVDSDLRLTDQLVRTALHAGASLLTIHGRTRHQSSASHPVDLDKIAFAVEAAQSCGLQSACASGSSTHSARLDIGVKDCDKRDNESVVYSWDGGGAGGKVPCAANGDVWTLKEAQEWRRRTGAQGVMSARGLLANPALFAGYSQTPLSAIHRFLSLTAPSLGNLPFTLWHRHLAYMLESHFASRKRNGRVDSIEFNALCSIPAVWDWLEREGYLEGAEAGAGPVERLGWNHTCLDGVRRRRGILAL